MTKSNQFVVDALVHPFVGSSLSAHLGEPFRRWPLRAPNSRAAHKPPFNEYAIEALPTTTAQLLRARFRESNVGLAVLAPLTFGLAADARFDVAVASALNSWLADTMLNEQDTSPKLVGSIRVAPRDVRAAVKEIEKWGSDPRFVQVAVTTEALAPYGQENYFPIWEAAASYGLPVLVCADNSRSVGPGLSPIGYPTHYLEIATLSPFAGTAHLVSLICSGVFERLESLVFVFGDGAFDVVAPLLWRSNKDWMALRSEVPWVMRPPSEYLTRHARFILSSSDGPLNATDFDRFVELTHFGSLLLYGSRYPRWDQFGVAAAEHWIPNRHHESIFRGVATDLYSRAT
jgi:uncharacterized protein